jgi:TRAP-type C4-dicarboxylate transport system substrate-binding protein
VQTARFAAAISLLVAFLNSSQAAELKFAIFAPPTGLVTTDIAQPWAEWATKESGGELQVKIHAGGTLGRNPAQQLKLVQDGVVDIAWIVPSYTPARFPTLAIFELPGIVANAREGSATAWELYKQGKVPGFEDVKLVGLFTTDVYDLHLSRSISRFSELKGLKVRSGGAIQNEIISALDMVPVGMPVTQIVESMSRNVIDGAIINWTSLVPFKVGETATFHYNLQLGVLPLAFVMNKATYDTLSAKARSVVDRSPSFVTDLGGNAFENWRAKHLAEYAQDPKHKIADPLPADQKEIDARLGKVTQRVSESDKYSAELDEVRAILARVRKK